MSSKSDGIGSALDQFRWDYEPPPAERRFFLRPVGAFFGNFKWEGRDGQFPVSVGQTEEPTSREE